MKIGELIANWRETETFRGSKDHGVRAIAREIGISHGTLSRMERGESVDGDTMYKVMLWLIKPKEESTNDN